MELSTFSLDGFSRSKDFRTASGLAREFRGYAESISGRINSVNVPGATSRAVQELFAPKALELGFTQEKEGLFADHAPKRLRPDFFRPLGPDAGILLEVERGKTTDNNMDLLDFWKCHICREANILFLFVPSILRQNVAKPPSKPFNTVSARLSSFFTYGTETNVQALFLFGY